MKKIIIISSILFLTVVILIVFFIVRNKSNKSDVESTVAKLNQIEELNLLSTNGSKIKQNLISSSGQYGLLVQTGEFMIVYMPPPLDSFAVEINTTNIEQGKESAISWLKSRGFSEDDICGIPTVFQVGPMAGLSIEEIRKIDRLPSFCPR